MGNLLALAIKYGPTVIAFMVEYDPLIRGLIKKYGIDAVIDNLIRSAVVAQTHSDPVMQLGSLLGNLTAHMPELRQIEPAILRHIQENADAAIREAERMDGQR